MYGTINTALQGCVKVHIDCANYEITVVLVR